MSDLTEYIAEMRAKHQPDLRAENEELRGLLLGFVTPPLRYSGKQALVDRARTILEGWVPVPSDLPPYPARGSIDPMIEEES